MKCSTCHTHLPEFGKFQKQVCPNCGCRVSVSPAAAPPRKPMSYSIEKAEKARDRLVWNMLIGLLFLLVAVFSLSFIAKDGPDLPYIILVLATAGIAVTTILFPFSLLHALVARRFIPKHHRPEFSPVLILLFFGIITVGLCVILALGINQRIEYLQNKHRFIDVEATITKIVKSGSGEDTEFDVYISYEINGKTYEEVDYPKYSSSMNEGDLLRVTIDPEKPEQIPQNGIFAIVIPALLMPVSLGLLYLTVIHGLITRRRKRKHSCLNAV